MLYSVCVTEFTCHLFNLGKLIDQNRTRNKEDHHDSSKLMEGLWVMKSP